MDTTVAYMIDRRVEHLHPLFEPRLRALQDRLSEYAETKTICRLELFEGYRHPARQWALSSKVTRAGPWESAHQYGMAADFARRLEKGFDWTVSSREWRILAETARECGLEVPMPGWDPGHVQLPEFRDLQSLVEHAMERWRGHMS